MKNAFFAVCSAVLVAFLYCLPTSLAAEMMGFDSLNTSYFGSPGAAAVPVPAVASPQAPKAEAVTNKYGVFTYQDTGESKGGRKLTGVNLLPQFADSSRHQQDVGSCHAFGGMAVLEAAYFRAHGAKVKLSEADIFLHRTVLSPAIYRDYLAGGNGDFSEGNDVLGDLKFAQQNGVASSLAYDKFVERYRSLRAAEKRTLEGIAKEQAKMSWLVKLLYNPRKHWAELQQSSLSKFVTENYLAGKDPVMEAERAKIKDKIKDFKISPKSFKALGTSVNGMTSDKRMKGGAGQKKLLVDELAAGRPVAVSMALSNLSSWGSSDPAEPDYHAFMIIGFKSGADGKTVFQTRNSWGSDNPDVKEEELCRIYNIISVKVPGE